MSSLSQAGKASLSNEVNRAFTKGLIGVDPAQLEKKQIQRRMYQEELRLQAEEHKKRKAAEKERERIEDEKLQRKIQMDIQKEKQESAKTNKQQKNPFSSNSNNNPPITNSKNPNQSNSRTQHSPPNQRKNLFNPSQQNPVPSKNSYSSPEISLYKHSHQPQEGYSGYNINPPAGEIPYSYAPRSMYSVQQEKYYQEEMENRARRFKETLDRKLEEVYRQIQASKKSSTGDNVVDQIRRRLKSNSYMAHPAYDAFDGQKSGVKQFQDEFSVFYKIPKRSGDFSSSRANPVLKNLDYDSQSKYKSSLRNYNNVDERNNLLDNSRMYTERQEKNEYNEATKKWGNKRKNNFLGNREALDYKIESALSNIDNIIQNHNMQGDGNF